MNNIELLEKNIIPDKTGSIYLSPVTLEKIECYENSIIFISVISNLILLHKFSMHCVLCNNSLDQVAKNNNDYICYKCKNNLGDDKTIKCINLNTEHIRFHEKSLNVPYYTYVKALHIYIPSYILNLALADKKAN